MNARVIGSGSFCALFVCTLLSFTWGASTPLAVGEEPSTQTSGQTLTVTVRDAKDQLAANCLVTVKSRMKPAIGANQPGGKPGSISRSSIGIDEPTLLQKGGAIVARMKTDANGVAEFKTIKPGDYVVECGTTQMTGFKRETITLVAGKDLAIAVTLK